MDVGNGVGPDKRCP